MLAVLRERSVPASRTVCLLRNFYNVKRELSSAHIGRKNCVYGTISLEFVLKIKRNAELMGIWSTNFSTDCMLVTKMKLLLHWFTVKSSCENSCWGQGYTFGTGCTAYTEKLYLIWYSTTHSKQKGKFCWRLSKSPWQENSVYLIHTIFSVTKYLVWCFHTFWCLEFLLEVKCLTLWTIFIWDTMHCKEVWWTAWYKDDCISIQVY